jgi:hypothetical protein
MNIILISIIFFISLIVPYYTYDIDKASSDDFTNFIVPLYPYPPSPWDNFFKIVPLMSEWLLPLYCAGLLLGIFFDWKKSHLATRYVYMIILLFAAIATLYAHSTVTEKIKTWMYNNF